MFKSAKNLLKRAKKEVAALPREMAVIQAEYTDLRSKAGDAGYQAYVYTKMAEQLNGKLESLNYEANARQQLDAQKPVVEAKTEETQAAQ